MRQRDFEAAPPMREDECFVEYTTERSLRQCMLNGLGVAGLALLAHMGGVTATKVAPAHIETANYAADTSFAYGQWNAIDGSTLIGGGRLVFNSVLPTPAIIIDPVLKPELSTSYSREGVDVLKMSNEQQQAIIAQVALELGGRYAAGAAIAMFLAYGGYAAITRRQSRNVALAMVASLGLAYGYESGSAAATYTQPYQKIEYYGLIGSLLEQGDAVLSGVSKRSEQIQPYFASWMEFQKDLTQLAAPMEKDGSGEGPKFLLISDLHGINMYGALAPIIKDKQITAVIDSGDLLNMGYVQEAELMGIFDGIEKLGVPYIFVLGNHDRNSPSDTALIKRLMKISNVVVLQPGIDTFQVAQFGDLKVAGVNDFMRWYGDDNKDNAAKQKPVAEVFNRTFEGHDIDVAVTHEPAAGEVLVAAVTNSGHLHKDPVNGTHIVTGTLTGGGPFGQNDSTLPDAQSNEQSYGILTFDDTCRATSLDTVRFHGMFEGKPTQDSITRTFFTKKPLRDGIAQRDCHDTSFRVSTVTTPREASR